MPVVKCAVRGSVKNVIKHSGGRAPAWKRIAQIMVSKNSGHRMAPVSRQAYVLPSKTGTMVAVKKGALTALTHKRKRPKNAGRMPSFTL